jgi:hypothetical protein
MMVPGLVDAIKRGDTKAIVSNAVGLGGGAAAMAAGMMVGGLAGAGIGLVLGGLVVGFIELFNRLFNPGTPISGPDPLKGMSVEDRTCTLQAAQTLLAHWDGHALNEGRLKDLAESGPNEDVKAAAKFFVDHPSLMQWMDASNAGGGDLEKRDARYDGNISKSDVSRYIGYMAVPPALYQTLPPPSKEARLWVLGIIDPQTHEDVVDAFGKDGEGQGSGDGLAALAEYANIASGTFDDRTRELLKNRYQGESDQQIEQRLQTLKKACAYLATYPSELRALESFKVSARETYQIKPGERSDDGSQVVWRLADGSELRVDINRLHNDLSKDIFQRLIKGELITEDEVSYLESDEGSDDLFEGDDWDTWMKFTLPQGRSTLPPKRAIPGRESGVAEDGRVGTDDIEAMRASYQQRIDDLLAQFPGGLPSFNDTAETNRAMGDENPALWRPDRFGNPNPDRPQSYEQVLLNHADQIDANSDGTLDWQEMADARERALHDRQYSLYFSLDYVLRNGADLFTDRGEGMDLKINKADLALRAGQERISLSDQQMLLPASTQARELEAATLSGFLEAHAKADRLEIDDLQRLSVGYWQDGAGQKVAVPEAVRKAALYFTQNPGEQAALSTVEPSQDRPHAHIMLTDLKTAGSRATPQSEVVAAQNIQPPTQTEAQRALKLMPQGATPAQEQAFSAYLGAHFDEIERMENPATPGDGKASMGDLKAAQKKALAEGNWEAYSATSWLMWRASSIASVFDAEGLLSKQTVQAQGQA